MARSSKASPALAAPLRTAAPRTWVTGSGSPVSADSSTTASSLAQRAVDRDQLAGADQHDVADGEPLDRDLLPAAALARGGRCVGIRSSSAVSSRRARREAERLQRVAAGEHQRDHRAGQVFADGQRPGHRDQGDRVDADPALRPACARSRGQRHQHHRDRRRPDRVARRSAPRPGAGPRRRRSGSACERKQAGASLAADHRRPRSSPHRRPAHPPRACCSPAPTGPG